MSLMLRRTSALARPRSVPVIAPSRPAEAPVSLDWRPVRWARRGPVNLNLWIPITLFGVMLTPLLVLALPVVNAVVLARGLDPRGVSAIFRVFGSLSGTDIDIQTRRANVRIRLF